MLKLNPIQSDKIWGYERWIASTHENGCQNDFKQSCGGSFPLLVKVIQTKDILSVQVHPNDEQAKELEDKNQSGKTECWYVLDCEDDAQIVYGLKENTSKDDIEKAVKENRLESYLNYVKVYKGDFIFIPSTMVHAIGKGIRILEIQQSCDLTYRFYDWGRGREVHLEKALKVINLNKPEKISAFTGKFECEYFSLEQINVRGGWSMYCSGDNPSKDTQLIYVLSEENAVIRTSEEKFGKKILPEEIYAVFPKEKITVEGKASIIRIRVNN